MGRPIRDLMPAEDDPAAIKYCTDCKKLLQLQFLSAFGWLAFLVVIFSLLNFLPFFPPENETQGSWLERSGALIGVIALAIELRAQRMSNVMNNATTRLPPALFKQVDSYSSKESLLHGIVVVLGALGAIIWSYGSPLLNSFKWLAS